ncbi:hypothetical protein ACVWZ3_008665 [Bradyrhizobium sp. i1.3.6]
MVDLFSMFRRRPAKRGRPGFARQDITALGDSVGGLVPSPVRDASPISRDQMRAPDHFQADYQADYQTEPPACPGGASREGRQQAQRRRRTAASEAAGFPGCA